MKVFVDDKKQTNSSRHKFVLIVHSIQNHYNLSLQHEVTVQKRRNYRTLGGRRGRMVIKN